MQFRGQKQGKLLQHLPLTSMETRLCLKAQHTGLFNPPTRPMWWVQLIFPSYRQGN